MNIKVLGTLSLSALMLLSGCGGSDNTNANRANMNTGNTAVVVATATPMATPAMDAATKATVEDAMKKKGFNDVTVEATTAGVTLRGTVAKGKMAEAVQAAQEAGKKPVKNELTEK